jgi:hypothetical protein
MKLFSQLDLPTNPLRDDITEQLFNIKSLQKSDTIGSTFSTMHHDIKQFLNSDLLDRLASINARPSYFTHFGVIDLPRNQPYQTFLHSDLIVNDEKWTLIPCGINWELTPGTTDFRWYDTLDMPHVSPPPPPDYRGAALSGIHYGTRFNRDVSQCTELAKLDLKRNTPYLLKTDIPHSVISTCEVDMRISISLRFSIKDVPSWEHALELLGPLLID